MHAFKLIGMLLDAHMNLMTIDIVRLLYSPKMVRLPSPSSRLAAAYLHATHGVVHALLPQLLDNIKEVQEVLLAASFAKGDADPDAESLGGFEARAYSPSGPLSIRLPCFPHCTCCVYAMHMDMECACSAHIVQKANFLASAPQTSVKAAISFKPMSAYAPWDR